MPIYEYECNECGHRFELRQGFDEEPVSLCPECRGRARRRLSKIAVIYKGSGFYTTDSRAPRPGEDGAPKADKSETKSETKPEKPAKTDAAEKKTTT